MAKPHNKERYGEEWNLDTLAIMQEDLEQIMDLVIVSGGWAWHFMTPKHTEYKHAHDHKDIDLFVFEPYIFYQLICDLRDLGYNRDHTKYDNNKFKRYTKNEGIKIILDIFIEAAPWDIVNGWKVIEPEYLLSLYGNKHQSEQCFSAQIARKLIKRGENPILHPEMANYEQFLDGDSVMRIP